MAIEIDAQLCASRLKKLCEHWEANRTTPHYNQATSLVIPSYASSPDIIYRKSIALHLYLFGYEFPDTLLIITPTKITFYGGEKKIKYLEPCKDAVLQATGKTLELLGRGKGEVGHQVLEDIYDTLTKNTTNSKIGTLLKEEPDGKTISGPWHALLASRTAATASLSTADIALGLATLLGQHDDVEVLNIKKASNLAAMVMEKSLSVGIESALDGSRRATHASLAKRAEEAIFDPAEKIQYKLKKENCEVAYAPVIQSQAPSSGGFDLRIQRAPPAKDVALYPGVVIASIGARYSSYCGAVGRTYIVDPTPKQEKEYRAALAAQAAGAKALVPGATLGAVYTATLASLQESGCPDLVSKLAKNVGFAIGLEYRDANYVITENNPIVVSQGMTFLLTIAAQGLTDDNGGGGGNNKEYALLLSDTFLVGKEEGGDANKPAECLTMNSRKAFADVAYHLEEDKIDANIDNDTTNNGNKKLRSDAGHVIGEAQRKARQEELGAMATMSTMERLRAAKDKLDGGGGVGGGVGGGGGRLIKPASEIVSYRNLASVPPLGASLVVQVDAKSETLLLPIYGVAVPFHLHTIKNITWSEDGGREGGGGILRVYFNVPGAQQAVTSDAATQFPTKTFIKELSFRVASATHAQKVVTEVKTMQRSIAARDRERAAKASLVAQARLQVAKGKVPALRDVWCRPTLGGRGRKLPGVLECHANGLRYTTPRSDETIDVLFANVKHAIFQPAEKEVMTLVHFHLHHPILINKKKTADVQFYIEVMEAVQTLDGGRRYGYDPDEIEEEQRERERRNRINAEFKAFTERVQEQWNRDKVKDADGASLEWERTYRKLAFDGVPHKSMSTLIPTEYALVELVEMPFTVITLKEVEVVNLERAALHLKNFDMVMVNKDFTKDVVRIEAIPMKSLETIKEWLNNCQIKYYESRANLNWKQLIKGIIADPESFEETGWEFLNLEASDTEDDEEDGSEFAPSDDSDASDSDDDEDDDDSDASLESEDEEDGSEYAETDDSESGLDWDELEAEAKKADRRKDESDEEGGGRKRKGGGGGGKAPEGKKGRR